MNYKSFTHKLYREAATNARLLLKTLHIHSRLESNLYSSIKSTKLYISHTFHILIVLKAFFVRTCCFKANLIQDKWVSFSFAQVL